MTFFGLTISRTYEAFQSHRSNLKRATVKDFAKNQWDIPISAFTSAYFKVCGTCVRFILTSSLI